MSVLRSALKENPKINSLSPELTHIIESDNGIKKIMKNKIDLGEKYSNLIANGIDDESKERSLINKLAQNNKLYNMRVNQIINKIIRESNNVPSRKSVTRVQKVQFDPIVKVTEYDKYMNNSHLVEGLDLYKGVSGDALYLQEEADLAKELEKLSLFGRNTVSIDNSIYKNSLRIYIDNNGKEYIMSNGVKLYLN
jgi:hypothetical protein